MNASDRSQLEQSALASGLLTEQQLDEARAGGRWSEGDESQQQNPPTDEQLADRLVELGRLNTWQAQQLLEGRTKFNLGPYWIVDSIAKGGMGQVFKAEHSLTGRLVAIKVLPLSKSTPDAVENFTREIRALASLNHPRLVRALDAGFDGNVYYLVIEYVSGADLRKVVRREGPLGMREAANIIYQVAEGLQHAHQQGLIHRDVKPGNVLVTPEGEAKLSDLGLAGPLEGDAESDPRFGKIVGTADYLSPDHINSPWEPTAAWDIYSLGCTLYYAVTGKVPFPGGTIADKARAHRELRPLDPRRLNDELSDEFVDVMADMMAKDPMQRIPSATQVMGRLLPWADRAALSPPSLVSGVPPAPPRATAPPIAPPPVVTPPPFPPRVAVPPPPVRWLAVRPPDPPRTGTPTFRLGESTTSDFPVMPRPSPGDEESPSQELEIAAPADASGAEMPWKSMVNPLLILVLLPLGLVVVAILIWMLVRLLW